MATETPRAAGSGGADGPDEQAQHDHVTAWACGLNLNSRDSAPGQREVVVGGPGEHRVLGRREQLLDSYTRFLITQVDADHARLQAIAEAARRGYADKQARGFDQRRLDAELVAIELAERGLAMLAGAGADTNDKARQRLLAACRYEGNREVFGAMGMDPNVAASPQDFLAELDDIDRGDAET